MTLEELRAAVEAMTPGPWHADRDGIWQGGYQVARPPSLASRASGGPADASGIVALRNVAPELLAVVEAVWKDLEGDGSQEAIIDAMRDVAEKLVSL